MTRRVLSGVVEFAVVLAVLALLSGKIFPPDSVAQDVNASASSATVAFDSDLYNDYVATGLNSLDDLIQDYEFEQAMYLPIVVPDPAFIHTQGGGLLAFDGKGFPSDFLSGLIPVQDSVIAEYQISVQEAPKTHERLVLNAKNEIIASVPAAKDYDPQWYVKDRFPAAYDSKDQDRLDSLVAIYDPSRIVITYTLIQEGGDLAKLVWKESFAEAGTSAATDASASSDLAAGILARNNFGGGGRMMMRWQGWTGGSVSNIETKSMGTVSNGVCLSIAYPDDYTNRLDVMSCTNLGAWYLKGTIAVDPSTNCVAWVDTNGLNPNLIQTFYAIGNGDLDTDGDGIPDAQEIFIYKTSPNSIDSDGDGLVDGYSGIVTTNAYPGGITTNGVTVEGELTWGTSPLLADTDDDGADDGWEVAHGHNPLDPNDPPNVRGSISYTGGQTGLLWVVAVTSSNSWSTNYSRVLSGPGTYRIPKLPASNYWVRAYIDSDCDWTNDATEAWAITTAAIPITNRVTGVNLTLVDPDSDTDGMPDWWELAHGLNPTNAADASLDNDNDGYTNLEEYQAATDPKDPNSHPWSISGAVAYNGRQGGWLYVVAGTSAVSWAGAFTAEIAVPGAYTFTHLPPNRDYWVWVFRDSDGSGSNDSTEACGLFTNNPVFLGTNVSSVDITLTDPDRDGDGLPDWWEIKYGLDPNTGGGLNAVAWWKLDETSGTNVADSSCYGNNGVVVNPPSNCWTIGVISNALTLNGTNYVQFPDNESLDPDYVSVSLWVKPSRNYTNGSAVFFTKKQPGASYGYELSYTNGALSFLVCPAGNKVVSAPCTLTQDNWYHLAGTYGGAYQRLYLNGTQIAVSNWNWGSSPSYIQETNSNPRIGASADSTPTNLFAGTLDAIQIYDHELASNEVYGIYEVGADFDQDGLSNWQEAQAGTCPTNSDTDGDGMGDWAELANGQYPLTSNVYDRIATTDFTEGFESNAVTIGALNCQHGWSSVPTNQVSVVANNQTFIITRGQVFNAGNNETLIVTNLSHSGGQAVVFGAETATNSYNVAVAQRLLAAHGITNVWIDCWAKFAPASSVKALAHPDASQAPPQQPSLFAVNSAGELVAYDGTGTGVWKTASNVVVTGASYHRYTVKQDYVNKTWTLYYDSTNRLAGLGFANRSASEFSRFSFTGKLTDNTWLDELLIGKERPSGLSD